MQIPLIKKIFENKKYWVKSRMFLPWKNSWELGCFYNGFLGRFRCGSPERPQRCSGCLCARLLSALERNRRLHKAPWPSPSFSGHWQAPAGSTGQAQSASSLDFWAALTVPESWRLASFLLSCKVIPDKSLCLQRFQSSREYLEIPVWM